MALQIHNVRTRRKEPFRPMKEGKAGFYVCGLTVYDHAHLGHARTAVSFEVVRRWLERSYDVRFVQNVTDVEDKILNRAKELGVSPREHAAKWDRICREAMERLGVRPPDEAPHVTDSVPDIVAFVEAIVERGFAYATEAGNVYFDVAAYDAHAREAFPDCTYGSLSRRDVQEMEAGTRKEVEADKRHPADFVLWKAAQAGDHPDSSWDSPWGPGRPGWHIECSLMSTRSLGDQIDLHGGGQDLIFPHHENEIAQSQAKTGKAPFVNVWMHAGFLNVEGQKMSKSLGNFVVLTELLDELEAKGIGPEALRFYFVQAHYRSKIDFTRAGLEEAARSTGRLQRTRRLLHEAAAGRDGPEGGGDGVLGKAADRLERDFDASMDDDFHTPGAVAALFAFCRAVNPVLEAGAAGAGPARRALEAFEDRGGVLTLFQDPVGSAPADGGGAPEPLRAAAGSLGIDLDGAASETEAVEAVLAAREAARKERDFARADAVRDALKEAGYVVEDTPRGARWSRA